MDGKEPEAAEEKNNAANPDTKADTSPGRKKVIEPVEVKNTKPNTVASPDTSKPAVKATSTQTKTIKTAIAVAPDSTRIVRTSSSYKTNNKYVFVKVVGTLPDTGDNNDLVIKISKASAEKLGVRDSRFQSELNYGVNEKP
jgi:hypothetical protein